MPDVSTGTIDSDSSTRLVDLTLPCAATQNGKPTFTVDERSHIARGEPFTGMVYHYRHDSMLGTYLDLPGHIKECDDGVDLSTYPLERLYRINAVVIRLDRDSGSGAVCAEDLEANCPDRLPAGALILNALGPRRFDEIDMQTVYLTPDAAEWIVQRGVHLLISDICESKPELQGCFNVLFSNNVSTVCYPINLHLIQSPRATVTVLAPRFQGTTQIACRVVAELSTCE